MDNAKAVAYQANAPVVIFPPNNPDIVIADLDILASTPEDHFAAGMADAIASWIEGRTAFYTDGDNLTEYRSSYTVQAMASQNLVTKPFENMEYKHYRLSKMIL